MENIKEKVIVAGHNVLEDGAISILLKNRVSAKNPLRRLTGENKATKSGSFFLNKGVTVEEAREAYPKGSVILDASWGKERITKQNFGGIYEIVFDEEVPEVVEETVKEEDKEGAQ